MQHKILTFLGSRRFLWIVIGVFTFEGIWIAFTGRYPGAFDENFHFGLIQLYAKHWLPFMDAQPPNAEVYGAVARDPSYLYHYLMSFPYRVITIFTHNQTAQIIVLRLLNVALTTTSLFLYAKILRRSHLSSLLQNAIMVLFTMIPVLPLLAGQVNYDNLLFIFAALVILATIRFIDGVRRHVWSGRLLLKILTLSLLACLTKYAFLPIFGGIVVYIGVLLVLQWKNLVHEGIGPRLKTGMRCMYNWSGIGLIVLFIIASGLFMQRIGVNLVRYHTPVPDCAQVITVKECSAYAPWQRDYVFKQTNTAWKREHIVRYADMWIHQMVRETYFSAYGAFFPDGTVDYKVVDPLPFMTILGWTLFISGLIAVILCAPKLLRVPQFQLYVLLISLYVAALFIQNYKAYVDTAVPVSIHGRYLLPILPLMFVLFFHAYRAIYYRCATWLRALITYRRQLMLASWIVLLLMCLQGGGIITHIVQSDSDWFWQQSPRAQKLNASSRKILRPLVLKQRL